MFNAPPDAGWVVTIVAIINIIYVASNDERTAIDTSHELSPPDGHISDNSITIDTQSLV